MTQLTQCDSSQDYDVIVVGSGNGACAFLSQYLAASTNEKILVLEEGDNFFETSDITHQRNWTQSFAEGNIFKLHNAHTPDNRPILSGRACTMGGGSSINYSMIFESSAWLVQHFGHDQGYWDTQKEKLAVSFQRSDPKQSLTPVAIHVRTALERRGFVVNEKTEGNIPVYSDTQSNQIHIFPTQFNEFGQRIASGVSLLDWHTHDHLDFMSRHRVLKLHLTDGDGEKQRCHAITVLNLETKEAITHGVGAQTKIILCAGAATPQLLYEHRAKLQNMEIGQHVNDHILLPFGIYLLHQSLQPTLKDQYISLFATTKINPDTKGEATVCTFDFFAGKLEVLLYLISHLFLAFWVPNGIKRWMIQSPNVFSFLKWFSRLLVSIWNAVDDVLWSILNPKNMGQNEWKLISAIVKFNIAREGYYTPSASPLLSTQTNHSSYDIILRCFEQSTPEKDRDFKVAEKAITDQLCLMERLGTPPHPIFQFLIRLLTRMPYNKDQVEQYIRHYSRNDLLTEQHLSGGCIFGKAIDMGLESPQDTGKVLGSQNIYVADLSAAPLPRVSPQMTAYLMGHHVATQLCREL